MEGSWWSGKNLVFEVAPQKKVTWSKVWGPWRPFHVSNDCNHSKLATTRSPNSSVRRSFTAGVLCGGVPSCAHHTRRKTPFCCLRKTCCICGTTEVIYHLKICLPIDVFVKEKGSKQMSVSAQLPTVLLVGDSRPGNWTWNASWTSMILLVSWYVLIRKTSCSVVSCTIFDRKNVTFKR